MKPETIRPPVRRWIGRIVGREIREIQCECGLIRPRAPVLGCSVPPSDRTTADASDVISPGPCIECSIKAGKNVYLCNMVKRVDGKRKAILCHHKHHVMRSSEDEATASFVDALRGLGQENNPAVAYRVI